MWEHAQYISIRKHRACGSGMILDTSHQSINDKQPERVVIRGRQIYTLLTRTLLYRVCVSRILPRSRYIQSFKMAFSFFPLSLSLFLSNNRNKYIVNVYT